MPSSPAETSLSDLAINDLGNKLPSLLPYLLGFELLTKNDEATRAAGLLGFDIGGSQVLMPVLFLNGKIKGTVSLYLRDSDTFVAASPEFVEFLTSRNSGNAGEPLPSRSIPGVPPMSLRIFNQPPMIAKRAELDSIFEEFMNPAVVFSESPAGFTVPGALKAIGKQACGRFMRDLVDNHPSLLVKLAELYPGDALKIQFPEEPKSAPVAKVANYLHKSNVEWATLENIYNHPEKFTTQQKEACYRDGLVIMDKRAKEEKSEVFADDYTQRFSTPTESGFYKMVNEAGELKDVFIAHDPFMLDNPSGGMDGNVIINPDSGLYYLPKSGDDVLARAKKVIPSEDFDKEFKKFSPISSAVANKTYVAINPKGDVSAPFEVESREKTPDYLSLRVSTVSRFRWHGDSYGRKCDSGCGSNGKTLRVIDATGGKLHVLGNILTVPSEWRIMEVNDGADNDYSSDLSWEEREKRRNERQKKRLELAPGSMAVLTQAIQDKSIKALEMNKKGSDYTLFLGDKRTGRCMPRMKKSAAMLALVNNIGLSTEDADAMFERVERNHQDKVWVKMADLYNGMPWPDDTAYTGVNDLGVPETESVVSQQQVPLDHPPVPDSFDPNLANYDKIKNTDADFLQRAADANTKEVFDPAMIGTILKSNRTMDQIDNWMPSLAGSLDKLCRMLLLFYWKQSDIADAYGKDNMAELEDSLLNGIKVMGELVLFFKQRVQETATGHMDPLGTA